MKHILLVFGLALVAAIPARADDAAERAIIAKAVKAHHGDVDSAKVAANTIQMKGTVHAMGMSLPVSGAAYSSGPECFKIDLEVEVAGQKFRVCNVLNGDKGWARLDKET